ncbi:natterin-3-like [Pseudopipra pipra]|uniref:natterin-3-like n=1 Tax=Pseudopipra pipra TaxID=415032 RepID=UPI00313886ED
MMPLLQIFLLLLGLGILGILGIPAMEVPGSRLLDALNTPIRKRDQGSPSHLKWEPFQGRLPPDAVSSWNRHTGRLEFICSTMELGCNSGSYDPIRGPYCYFPNRGQEKHTSNFNILVNAGGFEALDWVDDSFGTVPENAVESCPSVDVFVGRSRDGLGKVSKEHRALFVALGGEEVWYKWYQVLVVKTGLSDISIMDVAYNLSTALEHSEDVVLAEAPVQNEGCGAAPGSTFLEEATETEHTWRSDHPALATVRGTLRAAPLVLTGTGWAAANVTSLPWVGGASIAKFVSHGPHEVREEVPARSECTAVLRGRRRDLQVMFTAQLRREFRDGFQHSVGVTGWAQTRVVTGVSARIEQCRELTRVPPCPA